MARPATSAIRMALALDRTYLERDEPNAFQEIGDQDKVLEHSDARRVDIDIQEGQTHQALIKIQTLDVELLYVSNLQDSNLQDKALMLTFGPFEFRR
jgi:hypothetical protein